MISLWGESRHPRKALAGESGFLSHLALGRCSFPGIFHVFPKQFACVAPRPMKYMSRIRIEGGGQCKSRWEALRTVGEGESTWKVTVLQKYLRKAYDRVSVAGLISKLSQVGLSVAALKWFSSLLTAREQHVNNA